MAALASYTVQLARFYTPTIKLPVLWKSDNAANYPVKYNSYNFMASSTQLVKLLKETNNSFETMSF